MKFVFLATLGFFVGVSAYANDLYCDGAGGFEISNSPGNHRPWTKITVKKNAAVIVEGLNDNDGGFIQKDEATDEYVQVIRAATVRNGIVSSLILSILLNDDGGVTGVGNAVIFDGAATTVINGLNCKTP